MNRDARMLEEAYKEITEGLNLYRVYLDRPGAGWDVS